MYQTWEWSSIQRQTKTAECARDPTDYIHLRFDGFGQAQAQKSTGLRRTLMSEVWSAGENGGPTWNIFPPGWFFILLATFFFCFAFAFCTHGLAPNPLLYFCIYIQGTNISVVCKHCSSFVCVYIRDEGPFVWQPQWHKSNREIECYRTGPLPMKCTWWIIEHCDMEMMMTELFWFSQITDYFQ